MKKTTKFVLAAGIAAGTAAAVYRGLDSLLSLASRRDAPLFDRLSSRKATRQDEQKPYAEQLRAGREWLLAQPLEPVQIESRDGLKLRGHLLCCPGALRTEILLHGWREHWTTNLGLMTRYLHEHGCNVLIAEQRSHGESEGEYIGFGVLERYDCQQWAEYAAGRFGTQLPLYLGGVSMGATTVLMATGLELPENVRGVIADCGFTSPHAIIAHVLSEKAHLPEHPLVPLTSWLSRSKAGFGYDDYSTIEAMKQNRIPVLFFHGDADNFVPLAMTLENYLACSAPKELVIIEGAEHGMSYLVDPAAYTAALQGFFEAYDHAPTP